MVDSLDGFYFFIDAIDGFILKSCEEIFILHLEADLICLFVYLDMNACTLLD